MHQDRKRLLDQNDSAVLIILALCLLLAILAVLRMHSLQKSATAYSEIPLTDKISTFATVVIAAFAALQSNLFNRQTKIMLRQEHIAARQMAMAEAAERPLILPKGPGFYLGFAANPGADFPSIDVSLKNIGRGPALISRLRWGCFVSDTPPIPWDRDDRFVKVERPERGLIGYSDLKGTNPYFEPDETFGPVEVNLTRPLTDRELASLLDGNSTVWLDGHVKYTNLQGTKYETHFLWKYDLQLDLIVPAEISGRNSHT